MIIMGVLCLLHILYYRMFSVCRFISVQLSKLFIILKILQDINFVILYFINGFCFYFIIQLPYLLFTQPLPTLQDIALRKSKSYEFLSYIFCRTNGTTRYRELHQNYLCSSLAMGRTSADDCTSILYFCVTNAVG